MDNDYDYFTSQELFGNNSTSSQKPRTRSNLLNLPPMQPIIFDDDPHLKTIQVLDEEQQQQPEQTAGNPPTAAQLQPERPAVLPDEGQQKAATLNSSFPTSSDSSCSTAGGSGGKKETLQLELRNMGISLNLMLGTSMSRRRQPLPPAGGTDLETEKTIAY